MNDDPRADQLYWRFLDQYFGLELVPSLSKNQELFSEFDDEVKPLLVDEARRFVGQVMSGGTGRIDELLGANYTFLNERLAEFYGVSGVSGESMQQVELPAGERAGLLTHGGFLAVLGNETSGSPTLRGRFVRTKLLCQPIPEPPPNVNNAIEPPGEVHTTRQRYEEHLTRDDCRGCHAQMDPIGFGLENFDAVGRFRTEENGEPVDASGVIHDLGGVDVPFDGPRELVEALLASPELGDCVATHFFRYALGRMEQRFDECELERIQSEFAESGGHLPALLAAVVGSSTFQYRVKE
jgi:hypothetical protein